MLNFLYMFIIPTQFLSYTFKLSITWCGAVILSTFN
jgi:hypothetical protein